MPNLLRFFPTGQPYGLGRQRHGRQCRRMFETPVIEWKELDCYAVVSALISVISEITAPVFLLPISVSS